MLQDKDVVVTIAVKDLGTAKKFYADTLELVQIGAQDEEGHVQQAENQRSILSVAVCRNQQGHSGNLDRRRGRQHSERY